MGIGKFFGELLEGASKKIGGAFAKKAAKEGAESAAENFAKGMGCGAGRRAAREGAEEAAESAARNASRSAGKSTSKRATRETVENAAGSEAKAAGRASGKKATQETGERIYQGTKIPSEPSAGRAAGGSAAKSFFQGTGSAIKTTAGWAGNYAKYTAKHPIASLILSSVAYNKLTGRTLLPDLMDSVGGKNAKKEGLVKSTGEMILGKNEDGLLASATDILLGQGAYKQGKNIAGDIVGEAGDLYQGVKDGASYIAGKGADLYQSGKDYIGNYYSGNGMTANGNGGYYDPTTEQYPSTAQMTNGNQATTQPQAQQAGGVVNMAANGVQSVVDGLTGKNVSKTDLASLVASAYFMFSPFGKLGKIASIMLAGSTIHNINQKEPQAHQSVQQVQQYAPIPAVLRESGQVDQQLAEVHVEPVAKRSRGI
ncbi:MAG: hypothetical protein SOZ07_08420 [Prevotella sp.]|nr:hypothetical protein [Prevotella sp.]